MSKSSFITIKNSLQKPVWAGVSSQIINLVQDSSANSSSSSESAAKSLSLNVNGQRGGDTAGSIGGGGGIAFSKSHSDASSTSSEATKKYSIVNGPAVEGVSIPPGATYKLAIPVTADQYHLILRVDDTFYSKNQSFDVATQNNIQVKRRGFIDFGEPEPTDILAMSLVSLQFGDRFVSTPVTRKGTPAANVSASAARHLLMKCNKKGNLPKHHASYHLENLSSGDYVRIILADRLSKDADNSMYLSAANNIYYEESSDSDKQIWRIHQIGASGDTIHSTDKVFFTSVNSPDRRLCSNFDSQYLSGEKHDEQNSEVKLIVHATGFS